VDPFQKLVRFLTQNPIVLFVVVAWVAGVIGNVVRAAKKRNQQAPSSPQRPSPARPQRSAEEVAAEMRRILGLPPERSTSNSEPQPKPVVVRREVPTERPPTPVMPSAQDRRLVLHGDSHVGEGMQRREAPHGSQAPRSAIGSLGGRVSQSARQEVQVSRRRLVALDDMKRAFVMNEVLGKPLGLRDL
jgi:hypothetical protein